MARVVTNFNDAFFGLLENVAREQGMSVSEFVQELVYQRIEDEEDLRDAKAILEDESDEIISHEEFWRGVE